MKESQDDIALVEYFITGLVILFFGSLYFWLNSNDPMTPSDTLINSSPYTEMDSFKASLLTQLNSGSEHNKNGISDIKTETKKAILIKAELIKQNNEIAQLKQASSIQQDVLKQLKDNRRARLEAAQLGIQKSQKIKAEIAILDNEIKGLESTKMTGSLIDNPQSKDASSTPQSNTEALEPKTKQNKDASSASQRKSDLLASKTGQKKEPSNAFEKAIINGDINQPIIFESLVFSSGSSQLNPESNQAIDRIVEILKKYNHVNILIRGHTDSLGSIKANTLLSITRSKRVQQALIRQGINAARLTVEGVGSLDPISSNETAEGRKKNRRIELIIME